VANIHEVNMSTLEEKIRALPPEAAQEVEDFITELMKRNSIEKSDRVKQSWAGALKEFREQYTSLELQKKAIDWWGI